MSLFSQKTTEEKRRAGFSLTEIERALSESKVIVLEKRNDCNVSEVYYCINMEQIKEIIFNVFHKERKKAESFKEMCKTQPVYDGLVYGLTENLLNKCIQSNDLDDMLAYLSNFGFCCDGVFIEIKDKKELEERHFSKYPLDLK